MFWTSHRILTCFVNTYYRKWKNVYQKQTRQLAWMRYKLFLNFIAIYHKCLALASKGWSPSLLYRGWGISTDNSAVNSDTVLCFSSFWATRPILKISTRFILSHLWKSSPFQNTVYPRQVRNYYHRILCRETDTRISDHTHCSFLGGNTFPCWETDASDVRVTIIMCWISWRYSHKNSESWLCLGCLSCISDFYLLCFFSESPFRSLLVAKKSGAIPH